MPAVRLNTICLISFLTFVFVSMCTADDTHTACETSLVEDKPPCLEVTRYVPEDDGSNVLETTLVYIGKVKTNANNQIIREIKLPPDFTNGLPPVSYFAAPSGISMVLYQGKDVQNLGPAILASLKRSHLPSDAAASKPPRRRPNVYTDCPDQGIVTQPVLEIKGMSDYPLLGVSYDVLNASNSARNQQGVITDSIYDAQQFKFTTNYFECVDINLAPGTNLVSICCHYASGLKCTIEKNYVLRLDLKTNPPMFQVYWPTPGRQVCGETITIRGRVDDCSARVTGEIVISGRSKKIEGLIERGGRFWLENIPLLEKTNHLKITATDVVGNSSVTNMTIVKSEDYVVINPIPIDQLWQMQVTVTGKINPPDRTVWVNRQKADVQTNGDWMVTGVPLTKGGVAVFDVLAMPPSEQPIDFASQRTTTNSDIKPEASVSIKTAYTPAEIILNAGQPTYGTFKIHLTGTAHQSFVLQDSVNLIDWTPILTNVNSAATYDYYDTNVMMYGCRFFRIVPIR